MPITPLAPGLLFTMKGCERSFFATSEKTRAEASVPLPAETRTMSSIGLFGYSVAKADQGNGNAARPNPGRAAGG